MGKSPTSPAHLERILEAVGYASIINVYNFIGEAPTSYGTRVNYLKYKVAERLVSAGIARRIEVDGMYPKRFTTVYQLIDDKKSERMSNREWPHDSAVKDVAVAFYELYGEKQGFLVDIEYNVKFAVKEGFYQPDLWVRLTRGSKFYDFIIEIETSRQIGAVCSQKIEIQFEALKKGLIPVSKQGGKPLGELSKKPKFLYFITTREHNRFTFARQDVTLAEATKFKGDPRYIYIDEKRKEQEIQRAESLSKYQHLTQDFLFTPLHCFTQIDKPVWYAKSDKNVVKRPLINNL